MKLPEFGIFFCIICIVSVTDVFLTRSKNSLILLSKNCVEKEFDFDGKRKCKTICEANVIKTEF